VSATDSTLPNVERPVVRPASPGDNVLLTRGALVALLGRHVASEHEQETLQRLSHGLARHIVEHWPEISLPDRDRADRAARESVLSMLMVVNPGIQVYLLDADGKVADYLGEPGMVRQDQVDLQVVRAFLAGESLPLRGTDPMGSKTPLIFSAARFKPRSGDLRPPGYLYIVLDGPARSAVAGQLSLRRVWQGAAALALMGLFVIVGLEVFLVRRLTRPLQELARRIRDYRLKATHPGDSAAAPSGSPGGVRFCHLQPSMHDLPHRRPVRASSSRPMRTE
jgi:hypothetical protein